MAVKIPTIKSLKKKLRRIFNDFIRARDFEKGCISCGKRFSVLTAGWQAGHFYPSSVCNASLDFDELNLHGQCTHCNMNDGNKQGYRNGLIKRYGFSVIEKLEVKRATSRRVHWGVFEYKAMIAEYTAKLQKIGLPARAS